MVDGNNTPRLSPEYAVFLAGTMVEFSEVGAAVAALKLPINCKALGATDQMGGLVDRTTLLDKSRQSVSDLPEGPERPLGFIDNLENEDFTTFFNVVEQRKTVQFYTELPDKRTASTALALSGWQMSEITVPISEVIQIMMQGKQNNIRWGVAAPALDIGA